MTNGEFFDPAMLITEQAAADSFLARAVDDIVAEGDTRSREEILRLVRNNLAYWAGYYGGEVRERVERLFDCEHPILGKFAVYGHSTNEEAFLLGVATARDKKRVTLAMLRAGEVTVELSEVF